jgi:hypothetical protein
MTSTMVHVRLDEKIKQRAAKTLAAMGLSYPMRCGTRYAGRDSGAI